MLTVNFSEIDKSHTLDRDALIKGAKIKNNAEWKPAQGSSLTDSVLRQIQQGGIFVKTSELKTKLFATGSNKQLYSKCLGNQKADSTLLRSLLDTE